MIIITKIMIKMIVNIIVSHEVKAMSILTIA